MKSTSSFPCEAMAPNTLWWTNPIQSDLSKIRRDVIRSR